MGEVPGFSPSEDFETSEAEAFRAAGYEPKVIVPPSQLGAYTLWSLKKSEKVEDNEPQDS